MDRSSITTAASMELTLHGQFQSVYSREENPWIQHTQGKSNDPHMLMEENDHLRARIASQREWLIRAYNALSSSGWVCGDDPLMTCLSTALFPDKETYHES